MQTIRERLINEAPMIEHKSNGQISYFQNPIYKYKKIEYLKDAQRELRNELMQAFFKYEAITERKLKSICLTPTDLDENVKSWDFQINHVYSKWDSEI